MCIVRAVFVGTFLRLGRLVCCLNSGEARVSEHMVKFVEFTKYSGSPNIPIRKLTMSFPTSLLLNVTHTLIESNDRFLRTGSYLTLP